MKIATYIDIIIPVHQYDLDYSVRHWYVRDLYNSNLPFKYSYILDTHVFPCYNTSYSELFRRFIESNVDVSLSNRMNIKSISGAAALSKWGSKSAYFWRKCAECIKAMRVDDQASVVHTLKKYTNGYTFKQLSSNWFFASHGIDENGRFLGSGICYRSSVVVTGPVQWIHVSYPKTFINGIIDECILMNGKNDEYINNQRVYYLCGKCDCKKGPLVMTSKEQLQQSLGNISVPDLEWSKDEERRNSHSLYWSSYSYT